MSTDVSQSFPDDRLHDLAVILANGLLRRHENLRIEEIGGKQLRPATSARDFPVTCSPRDDVHQAMGKMKTHRVRRLPVVEQDGTLVGIVSMNDLVLAVAPDSKLGDKVVDTLQTISEHQLPVVVENHAVV